MSSERQSGSLGQALAIVALSLSSVAVTLAIVALVLATVSRESDEDADLHLADRYEFTVDFVQRAIDYHKENGREATLEYYNSPASVNGPWYVFIYDENNVRIAHPTRPDLLGKAVDGPSGVDVYGYAYGKVIAETDEDGQWVDYVFLNPATGRQEYKHSWFIRHDGLLFGSGWYQTLPVSPIAPTKADPADYTVAVVDRAIRYYKAHGLERTVEYFNSPENTDGQWYVFIVDETKTMLANINPALVGVDISTLGEDVDGVNLADLEVGESGRWAHYEFQNPTTGDRGVKHSWVVLYDDIVFGSGWYE